MNLTSKRAIAVLAYAGVVDANAPSVPLGLEPPLRGSIDYDRADIFVTVQRSHPVVSWDTGEPTLEWAVDRDASEALARRVVDALEATAFRCSAFRGDPRAAWIVCGPGPRSPGGCGELATPRRAEVRS